ncbi:MAG: hypothetical protein FWD49_02510 [Firmicutes bacterium]|nr:hypothetical protein [Bacillota bacterium]
MAEFVAKSEDKKAELLAKAKKAKTNNDNASFKLACFGLATTLSLKNKVEKMISTIEIVMTLKDVADMSKGFLGGMESVCAELAQSTKGLKFDKVLKGFDGAMSSVGGMFEGLDSMMNDMTLGFETMDMELDPTLSRQIQDMIEKEEIYRIDATDDLDKQIEEKMKRLQSNKA